MKKISILFIASIAIAVANVLPFTVATPAAAATPEQSICEGTGGTWIAKDNACSQTGCTADQIKNAGQNDRCAASKQGRTVMGTIRQITALLTFLVGVVAVLMIIIAGIKYVTSQGDQAAISSAKNTLLYAVVGLVVATMAYAIVNFVSDALKF